jgi:dihydrodipicolinate synthase/N-acetylneuraminate lyase
MSTVNLLARNCTLFTPTKALDEDAYRESLQRFVEFGIGPFLASGGSGEANSLSWDEVRRVYQIGVEVCRDKVPVYANMPEVRSAREAIDFSRLAIETGVDIVNLYGPASLHGYRPTDGELTAYFDEVLTAIKHPVTLAPNPIQGYTIKARLIAELCNRYPQVESVTLNGLDGDAYFIDLRDALTRDVGMNVPLSGSFHTLGLGATGLSCNETNFIPRTLRQYVDCYDRGDLAGANQIYADLRRFQRFVEQWPGARWQKMALKVFRLPGGEGGLRKPYLMPGDAELERFTTGLLALGLAEIDELARSSSCTQQTAVSPPPAA